MPSSASSSIKYDTTFMASPRGETGQRIVVNYSRMLTDAQNAILDQRRRGLLGWLDLPFDADIVKRVQAVAAKTKKFETLLVLGIGGSDLGTRTILQALNASRITHHASSGRQVLFAGANTDPDELEAILKSCNWKKTCVDIVSKSGDTLEPMSAFLTVRDRLKKAVGQGFASHIIATTDAEKGTLHELAVKEGYHLLVVPSNVGGRFSVLSDVGLFPAAWVGISIKDLLAGAADQVSTIEEYPVELQPAAQYAALHYEWYTRFRHSIFVLMPYASRLESFGKWYRQLIAESLGKARNRNGVPIENGPTPIAALGATDQHSQLQLYMEGPRDKVVTFVEVEKYASALRVPSAAGLSENLSRLAGISFEDLNHAERQATAEALAHAKRPSGTLFIKKLDAYNLGALFQMFMNATAYLGELFNLNAYDQPGVEEGKKRFQAWLEGR